MATDNKTGPANLISDDSTYISKGIFRSILGCISSFGRVFQSFGINPNQNCCQHAKL